MNIKLRRRLLLTMLFCQSGLSVVLVGVCKLSAAGHIPATLLELICSFFSQSYFSLLNSTPARMTEDNTEAAVKINIQL